MDLRTNSARHQVDRILNSSIFRRAERLKRFLRFITEAALEGRSDRLKELVIGVQVFDKPETFDPRLDATVRVEAPRLRAKLAEYYASDGKNDSLLIEIPKGAYIPIFHDRTTVSATEACFASFAPAQAPSIPVFVGREKELAQLHDHLEKAALGQGRMVAVFAEPGIGKTAVVEAFLERARLDLPARIGRGRCRLQLQAAQPYQAWLEVLASLASLDDASPELLRNAAPHWWNLFQFSPGAFDGTHAGLMRREMEYFFHRLTSLGPVVLFIDDLHWADSATIEILHHIMPAVQAMKLLVVGAYRPSDMKLQPNSFRAVELELKIHRLCYDLMLPGLDFKDVMAYLDHRFSDHAFPAEVIDSLYDASAGNCLCLTDMVELALQRGWIVQENDRWRFAPAPSVWRAELPNSVAAIAAKKLEELNKSDREIAWICALQGVEFDSAVAAHAMKADQAQLEERLDFMCGMHCLLRRVSAEFPQPRGARYEFAHVLYHDALQAWGSPARRTELSQRTAEAMIAAYGEDNELSAPIVARLLEESGDPSRALRFYVLAATRAARVAAFQHVLDIAHRGLALVANVEPTPETKRLELELLTLQSLSISSRYGYEHRPLEAIYARVQELADDLGDLPASLRTDRAYWSFVSSNDLDRGLEVATALLRRAKYSRDLEYVANGHFTTGVNMLHRGRFHQAARALSRAYAAWNKIPGKLHLSGGAMDLGVSILCNLARALWFSGRLDQARITALQAWERACDLEHQKSKVYALAVLADISHLRRESDDTLRWADQAIEAGRKYDFNYELTWASVFRASALTERGEPDEGCLVADQFLAHYQGPCRTKFWCHCAWSFGVVGNPEKAHRLLDDAFQSGQKRREIYYDAELLRVRGELLLMGAPDRSSRIIAAESFEKALRVARSQRAAVFELRALSSLLRFDFLYRPRAVRREVGTLEKVVQRFKEGLDTPDLIQARKLLLEAGHRPPDTPWKERTDKADAAQSGLTV